MRRSPHQTIATTNGMTRQTQRNPSRVLPITSRAVTIFRNCAIYFVPLCMISGDFLKGGIIVCVPGPSMYFIAAARLNLYDSFA